MGLSPVRLDKVMAPAVKLEEIRTRFTNYRNFKRSITIGYTNLNQVKYVLEEVKHSKSMEETTIIKKYMVIETGIIQSWSRLVR